MQRISRYECKMNRERNYICMAVVFGELDAYRTRILLVGGAIVVRGKIASKKALKYARMSRYKGKMNCKRNYICMGIVFGEIDAYRTRLLIVVVDDVTENYEKYKV